MNKQKRIVWSVRHGLREDCDPVKWCEPTKHMIDPDLQPLGEEMARRVAKRLAHEPVDHLVSSPFIRTIRTSHYLAEALNKPIKVEHGLHEILDIGHFPNGIPVLPTPEERAQLFPEIDLSYKTRVVPTAMEIPSNDNIFGDRITRALDALLASLDGNLMFVSHYAVCNGTNRYFTGALVDGFIELTSVSKYVQTETGWTAEYIADASHIHGILEGVV